MRDRIRDDGLGYRNWAYRIPEATKERLTLKLNLLTLEEALVGDSCLIPDRFKVSSMIVIKAPKHDIRR